MGLIRLSEPVRCSIYYTTCFGLLLIIFGLLNVDENWTRLANKKMRPIHNQVENTLCLISDDRVTIFNLSMAIAAKELVVNGSEIRKVEECLERQPEKLYCVPRVIHFIWVGEQIPEKYQKNINTFTTINPDYQVVLWTEVITDEIRKSLANVTIRDLTKEIVDYSTKDLVDNESNFGGKSDILRYEVVYRNGGVYFDTDSISVRPLHDVLTHSFVAVYADGVFFNPEKRAMRYIQNSVFGFPKGSMFLEYVLRQLRVTIKKDPTAPVNRKTGPVFFSGAFFNYSDDNINIISGDSLLMHSERALTYQTMDGSWLKKK